MVVILKSSEAPLRVSREWSDVLEIAGAGPDRLTYVPGFVGDITEWIVGTCCLPNLTVS